MAEQVHITEEIIQKITSDITQKAQKKYPFSTQIDVRIETFDYYNIATIRYTNSLTSTGIYTKQGTAVTEPELESSAIIYENDSILYIERIPDKPYFKMTHYAPFDSKLIKVNQFLAENITDTSYLNQHGLLIVKNYDLRFPGKNDLVLYSLEKGYVISPAYSMLIDHTIAKSRRYSEQFLDGLSEEKPLFMEKTIEPVIQRKSDRISLNVYGPLGIDGQVIPEEIYSLADGEQMTKLQNFIMTDPETFETYCKELEEQLTQHILEHIHNKRIKKNSRQRKNRRI